MSFARKSGHKHGQKLMATATKIGIDAAKAASKRVVQKTEEPTRDFIGKKRTSKIVSVGKLKSDDKRKKVELCYTPPE